MQVFGGFCVATRRSVLYNMLSITLKGFCVLMYDIHSEVCRSCYICHHHTYFEHFDVVGKPSGFCGLISLCECPYRLYQCQVVSGELVQCIQHRSHGMLILQLN